MPRATGTTNPRTVMSNGALSSISAILGGADAASEAGFTLRSLIRLKSQGMDLLRPHLSATEYDVVCSYLSDPAAFQSVEVQRQLRVVAEAR